MEDKLLDELIASYKGDAFADWLKGAVEKNGDLVTAEKIIDDYSFRHAGSQIPGTIGYSVNYWARVKKEFDKLVCGHSQYAKEGEDYYVFGKFFSLFYTRARVCLTTSPLRNFALSKASR